MPRHEIHPQNPQGRLLADAAVQLLRGAVLALPTAAGYGLVCRLEDKAASARLRRRSDPLERAPVRLLCRDLAQAAGYLAVDDRAFRAIRTAADGSRMFALRGTRRLPRRLGASTGGIGLLHFSGQPVAQALLEGCDEVLLMALPAGAACATCVEALPMAWLEIVDLVLDAGPLPRARPPALVDLDGLLQEGPRLTGWMGAVPVPA